MSLQELTDTPFGDVAPHLGVIAVMNGTGDIKYTWDPKNTDEVNAARIHFADLKAKGFLIFKMKRWVKDKPVEEFDSSHGRLVFTPPNTTGTSAANDGEQVAGKPEVGEVNHFVAVPPMQGG